MKLLDEIKLLQGWNERHPEDSIYCDEVLRVCNALEKAIEVLKQCSKWEIQFTCHASMYDPSFGGNITISEFSDTQSPAGALLKEWGVK